MAKQKDVFQYPPREKTMKRYAQLEPYIDDRSKRVIAESLRVADYFEELGRRIRVTAVGDAQYAREAEDRARKTLSDIMWAIANANLDGLLSACNPSFGMMLAEVPYLKQEERPTYKGKQPKKK